MKRPKFEPVVLLGALLMLGNLGSVLHKSSRVYLFQQAQCFNYYEIHDATKIDANYRIEEALCKLPLVQSRLSMVDGVDSFLQSLPREPSLDFLSTLHRCEPTIHTTTYRMLTRDLFSQSQLCSYSEYTKRFCKDSVYVVLRF